MGGGRGGGGENEYLACFWRWKIYQVETCSLSRRTSSPFGFVFFGFARDNAREIYRDIYPFETIINYQTFFQSVHLSIVVCSL